MPAARERFDFIIVWGGSAGCVLVSSKFQTQQDRSECVMAGLLVELAGSPDAHDGEPQAMSSNDPLAADAESCLRDPRPPADMMAMPEQVAGAG